MKKKLVAAGLFLVLAVYSFCQYVVDFEGAGETKLAYASGTVNLSGLDWDMTEALIGTSDSDFKNGARSTRLRGYGESSMTMLADKTGGLGTLSFQYRRYGTDGQVDWLVQYSTDGGANWSQIGADFTAPDSDIVQVFSETVNIGGNIRIRIKRVTESGTSNMRLNIDDITLTDYSGTQPYISLSGSLSAFNTSVGTPSATQSYNLSGGYLTEGIAISIPFGFELSTDGGASFYSTSTLVDPDFDGSVLVRLDGIEAGYYSGNIVHSSNGATDASFFIEGTIGSSTGYYSGIYGFGDTIKGLLHNLVKDNHTTEFVYYYTTEQLQYTDEDPATSDNVITFYTGWSMAKTLYPDNWNKEHTWSKSHGDFGETAPAGTDLHNLRPCDASINSSKSNKDFAEGGDPVTDNSPPPGYSGYTGCFTTTDTWEPRDADKGDTARIIMYMAVRYEGDDYASSANVDLEIVDHVYTDEGSNLPYYGKLATLLQWHDADPPDAWELRRNDRIEERQGNRNPFIDMPHFATRIWAPCPTGYANVSAGGFTASWSAPIDASSYFLQVVTDTLTLQTISGYDNLDVDLATSWDVTGLSGIETCYFRLRSFFEDDYSMYSPFMEVPLDDPLPVELAGFFASISAGNNVALRWVTQSETGVLGFYVHRSMAADLAGAVAVSSLIEATNTSQQQMYYFEDSQIPDEGTYRYWLQSVDLDGTSSWHGPVLIAISASETSAPQIPLVTELGNIYPNPFNPVAYMPFTLAESGRVDIAIYNSRGQIVRGLALGHKETGNHSAQWDGRDSGGNLCPTGVYLIRLKTPAGSFTRKAVLAK